VVARQLGYGVVDTVPKWVNQAGVDAGERPGITTEDNAKLRQLEQENRELPRPNEILRSASAFFAAELDRPHRWG
jgi:transposase